MRDLVQRVRTARAEILRTVLIAGLVGLFVVLTGIAPAPTLIQAVLTLVAAVLLSVATAVQLSTAPPDGPDRGGRHAAHGLASLASLLPSRDEVQRLTSRLRAKPETGNLDDRWARHVESVTERWQRGERGVSQAGGGNDDPGTTRQAGRGKDDPATAGRPAAPVVAEAVDRPLGPGLSRRRITAAGAAAVALAVVLWLPIGVVGHVAVAVATFLFGSAGYAAPLLPALALGLLPPAHHEPVPWRLLFRRRGPGRRDLGRVALAALVATRERVLTRPAGIVLVTLGALHLLRDSPGFTELGLRRGGGIVGMVVGEPLYLLCSPSGGIGLLCAVLVSVAVAGTAYLRPYRGQPFATAALAVLLAVPLVGLGIGRLWGYDYVLGVRGDRVVVLAGVARDARHEVSDTGLSTRDIPAIALELLDDGIPVADTGDGERLAQELAQPPAVRTFPGSAEDLTVGTCFTTVGPQAELRYATPCGTTHSGEVYFIGRLPLTNDPGPRIADAVARAVCEKAYGGYLGVPFGGSYLPVETPLRLGTSWTPRPVIACWLRAVGAASLHGSRVVAALTQQTNWDTGPGCRVTKGDNLTLVSGGPGTGCVTPHRGRPESVGTGTLTIDATLTVGGSFPAGARAGVSCVDGADAASGYYLSVLPDATLELWKHVGTARTGLQQAKARRASTLKPDAPLDLHVTCGVRADGAGVDISASLGGTAGTTLQFSDLTQPVRRISPRLYVEAGDPTPITVTVTSFTATLG